MCTQSAVSLMEIKTNYSTLRSTTDSIINLVSKMSGTEKEEISIRSSINNDLGIDGDDWVDLQEALKEKEGLSLEGLQFYDSFIDEGQIADLNGFIIATFHFICYLLTFRWVKGKFAHFYQQKSTPKDILTIGDLITSKFEGRFVKRSERKFIFSKNG